jgi:hypothetical protein
MELDIIVPFVLPPFLCLKSYGRSASGWSTVWVKWIGTHNKAYHKIDVKEIEHGS